MMQIVECPRDAMQGIKQHIPTSLKIEYINHLLKVGFDTIDFGSFVSPKAVPQMADTAEVLEGLDLSQTSSKLLAIVANRRGAENALEFSEIDYLGYPFSISETFQQRNTKKSISNSVEIVREVQQLCLSHQKEMVVYLSMAFGNPYGDPWSVEILEKWAHEMRDMGIGIIALADTVGNADQELIRRIFGNLLPKFGDVSIGAHFHALPEDRMGKIEAAYDEGCRRFDVALKGFGGCPFAKDDLVGNIATESLLDFCQQKGIETGLEVHHLNKAMELAPQVFG